ncbi:MAG TPA: LPXTG cell wall anchor domain-containing protein [Solirubrobacteraceae bacterium]|nr:LPXTG cell wall anchor domain-containing protein [Solirubrobacteraceae bacterium]
MPISRVIAALLVTATLAVPAAATAQTTTVPRSGASVSNTPPVPLTPGNSEGATAGSEVPEAAVSRRSSGSGSELPNTGSDPRMLFAFGVALTLLGVGLRLRTADAELY